MTCFAKKCQWHDMCKIPYDIGGCSHYKEKRPQTNEEYIKSLDTEQLAEWMAHQSLIALLENQNNHSLRMTYPAYWVEWLKQPHKE